MKSCEASLRSVRPHANLSGLTQIIFSFIQTVSVHAVKRLKAFSLEACALRSAFQTLVPFFRLLNEMRYGK